MGVTKRCVLLWGPARGTRRTPFKQMWYQVSLPATPHGPLPSRYSYPTQCTERPCTHFTCSHPASLRFILILLVHLFLLMRLCVFLLCSCSNRLSVCLSVCHGVLTCQYKYVDSDTAKQTGAPVSVFHLIMVPAARTLQVKTVHIILGL